MEDGSSMPLWGLFVLLLLLWLNGIFYGFAAALRNISENDTQKKAEEGDKKAQMLMTLIDKPAQFVNAIPLIVMACGICFGTFLVPYAVDAFYPYIKHVPALILVMALCVIFLAAIGILAFRRVGTYHPEAYAYKYLNLVHFWLNLLKPFTVSVTWIARLAAVPFGVEINRTEKSVTEEEIISIVDEAHEQGVIQENEAEMIQNILHGNDPGCLAIFIHNNCHMDLSGLHSMKKISNPPCFRNQGCLADNSGQFLQRFELRPGILCHKLKRIFIMDNSFDIVNILLIYRITGIPLFQHSVNHVLE